VKKINYCFSICNALTKFGNAQSYGLQLTINGNFIAILRKSIHYIWSKHRNIYLEYFGILSFGKLGPVSLSLSLIYSLSNRFTRYTHIEEIDMREIDFTLLFKSALAQRALRVSKFIELVLVNHDLSVSCNKTAHDLSFLFFLSFFSYFSNFYVSKEETNLHKAR